MSVCACDAELVLTDATDDRRKFLSDLAAQVVKVEAHLEKLATYDNILSVKDWGIKWAEILKKSELSVEALVRQVDLRLQLNQDGQTNGQSSSVCVRSDLLAALRNRRRDGVAGNGPEAVPTQSSGRKYFSLHVITNFIYTIPKRCITCQLTLSTSLV